MKMSFLWLAGALLLSVQSYASPDTPETQQELASSGSVLIKTGAGYQRLYSPLLLAGPHLLFVVAEIKSANGTFSTIASYAGMTIELYGKADWFYPISKGGQLHGLVITISSTDNQAYVCSESVLAMGTGSCLKIITAADGTPTP